jgi:hypothetical protein
MKWILLVALAIGGMGCEYYTLVPEPTELDGECVPETVMHTRVPSSRSGGIYIALLCTECDVDECNSLGARCDIEGESCDFYGKLGVCRGCCDSEYGELHCDLVSP